MRIIDEELLIRHLMQYWSLKYYACPEGNESLPEFDLIREERSKVFLDCVNVVKEYIK